MADYPTLGLKFDLNELRAGLQALGQSRNTFQEVGDAAASATQAVKRNTDATKEGGNAAQDAANKRKRAADSARTAEEAQQRQIRETIRTLRLLNDVARAMSLEQNLRSRMKLIESRQIAEAERTLQAGAVRLITVAQNQGVRIQAAVARMIAPPALAGAERARVQAEMNNLFGAIENTVANGGIRLVTRINQQAARIRGAMQNMIAPAALTGAARAARQAELDSIFNAIPASGGGRGGGRGGGGSGLGSGGEMGDNRGIIQKTAAMVGLGRAYDAVIGKGGNLVKHLGQARVALLNARFAAALFIGALTIGPVAAMADAMVALDARTRLYAERGSDVPVILESVYRTAQRARQPLEGIATLYTRLAPLSEQLGRSQAQILRVVETVAKSFTLGGAAASEATASAQQFAQALSSNRFGGDELRSVAENAPVLLAAIAEGVNKINPSLNLNAATFIKWAQAGNANATVMVQALENAQAKIDAMFKTMPVTISQGISVFGNAITYAIDQIDRLAGSDGQRLSTQIAEMIAGFARFVESEQFINGVVSALKTLQTILEVVGKLVQFLADNGAILAAILVSLLVARQVAAAFTAMQLAFALANRQMTLMTVAAGANRAAMAGLLAMGRGVLAMFGGPWGLALAAAAGAVMFLKSSFDRAAEAMANLEDSGKTVYDALDRAKLIADAYGNSTEELTRLQAKAAGVSEEQADALDEVALAAEARAKQDKAMAIAALAGAKADLQASKAALERAAALGQLGATALRVSAALAGWWTPMGRMQRNLADNADTMVQKAREAAGEYTKLIGTVDEALGAVQNMTFTPTAPSAGSGGGGGNAAADDAEKTEKGLRGALRRIADLRADLTVMQKEVAAAEVGFFGPGGLDQLEAERAALEALAKYGVQSLEDIKDARQRAAAATETALAAEVALQRLETDRITNLIQQRRETDLNTASLRIQNSYLESGIDVMRDYYEAGAKGGEEYAQALADAARLETAARVAAAARSVAQQFGVETTAQLTGKLRDYAQKLVEAKEAEIELEDATERSRRAREADNSRQAEIADMEAYIKALRDGTRAMLDYERASQITSAIEAAGPAADPTKIANDVDRKRTLDYERRIVEEVADVRRAEIEARLTADERERGHYELILSYMAANKTATIETARIAVEAATRELALRRQIANVQKTVQDSVRESFINAGRLDFTSLREALGQSIRKAVYDNLMAKPINAVVNAVVNVVTRGIEGLVQKIVGATSGESRGAGLADMFKGGMNKLGEQFGNIMDKLPKGLTNAIKGAGTFLGQAGAGYGMGAGISDMLGLKGSGRGSQQWLDMGASAIGTVIGGPIGGAIATIASRLIGTLFGDKKRPLAVTALEVQNGRWVSRGTQSYDGGPGAEIDQAGKELAGLLNNLAKVFNINLGQANGLYTLFGWTAGENTKALGGEGFFGGMLREFQSIQGMTLDQIKGSALGRGVDLSRVKDAQEAIDKILREMVIKMGDAANNSFTAAEKALIRAADSLEDAAKTLYAARNVETNLQRALLQYTNPREFALANLRDQQLSRRSEIMDLVRQGLIAESRLPGIEKLLQQLESEEIRAALEQFADGVNGAVASLEKLREAQDKIAEYVRGLLIGTLSPLSPSAQLAISAADFQSTLAKAQGGDLAAMQSITDRATEYLSAAQKFYGATPEYAAIFDQVTQALTALSAQEFEDPMLGAIADAADKLKEAIDDGFLRLIEVILTGENPFAPGNDNEPAPGEGGGGYGGGGGAGAGGGDMANAMAAGFRSVTDQLASLGEVVNESNRRNASTIVDGVSQTTEQQAALAGGMA